MIASLILSVLAGLLLGFTFPFTPPGSDAVIFLPWLVFVAPVPLFIALRRLRHPLAAWLSGFVTGYIFVYVALFWISSFGQFALSLMSAYLALWFGIFCVVLWVLLRFRSDSWNYLIIPAAWVAAEYLHCFGATAFPWLTLGNVSFAVKPLLQLASIGGVFAVSFFQVFVAYAIFDLFWGRARATARFRSAFLAALVMVAMVGWGAITYSAYSRSEQKLPQKQVALVQGGIGSLVSWSDREFFERSKNAYVVTTRNELKQEAVPALVLWPESALPILNDVSQFVLPVEEASLWRSFPKLKLVQGMLMRDEAGRLQNVAVLLTSPASPAAVYAKVRLVPYGEFVPLGQVTRFLSYPWGKEDLTAGSSLEPLDAGELKLAANICFDSIFPGVSRAQVRKGANVIALVTNNSWFSMPAGVEQHAMMDYFRAVENRRPLVRAATTGVSHFILPSGRLLAASRINERCYLERSIPLLKSRSFYLRFGDLFSVLCLLATAGLFIYRALMGVSEELF